MGVGCCQSLWNDSLRVLGTRCTLMIVTRTLTPHTLIVTPEPSVHRNPLYNHSSQDPLLLHGDLTFTVRSLRDLFQDT